VLPIAHLWLFGLKQQTHGKTSRNRIMNSIHPYILALNGGSSSIKFALYRDSVAGLERKLYGKIDRLGLTGTHLAFIDPVTNEQKTLSLTATDYQSAANFLFDWLEARQVFATLGVLGHRIVQGMQHSEPVLVNQDLLDELKCSIPYDPDHLPNEIKMITTLRQRYPTIRQVACFDTAFHHNMPAIAKLLPIPRHYQLKGVQRYGFHGLSYCYLLAELQRLGDSAATEGRVILAHLGSGSSLAAVLNGISIDTSMGFTPASGVMMSTRSGDLDPGLIGYLGQSEKMTLAQFSQMINHESGLLGVSELSSDIRDLLAQEHSDERAAEAIALYCYQVKKCIGAFAAALGGLDSLVFSGGIGENSPAIRARICAGLDFLNLELQPEFNAKGAELISTDYSEVSVRVIRTDEEQTIAVAARRFA
jgi:acetate kinase